MKTICQCNQTGTQILNPHDERWMEFSSSHPEVTVFHHPAWITHLSECYGYRPFILVVLDDKGEISAGLPVMEVKSLLTGRRWVSLPFTDYCVPLYKDDESLNRLTNWFILSYKDKRVPRIELRWEFPNNQAIRRNCSYVMHTIHLNQDADAVAKNFKRVHRQNIYTAESRGVRIEWGNEIEHLRAYYKLQLETRHRQGIPAQPWRFFKSLASSIFQQGLGFVLLAYKDEECLAGLVCFHWQKNMIAKYAASKEDKWQLRANNLLFWKGIQWGCQNGLSFFGFGRTDASNEGLRRFKRGWGAIEHPLTYSTLFDRLSQSGTAKLQNIVQTVIKKSPIWMCRLVGELFYRHSG